MVMLKFRKVKMQGARFLLIIITFFFHNNLFSQSKELMGRYKWVDPTGETSIMINYKNNYFTYKSEGDFGGAFISKGYYLLKNDTLILSHEGITDPQPSKYKVIEKVDSSAAMFGMNQNIEAEVLNMSLIIFDTDKRPLSGTFVTLISNEKVLCRLLSDSEGKVNIYTEGRVADKVRIGFIGLKNLEIDLSDYWGYSSTIEIVLTSSNYLYNQDEFLEKYILSTGKDGTMKLQSLTTNKILIHSK